MKCLLFVLTGLLALSVHSQCLYQTSFEAEGEPFGNWQISGTVTDGGATSLKAHSGKSSMSPGYGDGKYGASKKIDFDPPLKAESIWVSYWLYADRTVSYLSFMHISGQNEKGEKKHAVYFLANHNYVCLGYQQKVFSTGPLLGMWHKYEYELDFAKQRYNFYLDGKRIAEDMAFDHMARGAEGKIINLTQLSLGGTGSSEDATFYDDLYIGTERAPDQLGGRMQQVAGNIDTRVFMQIGRLGGTAPAVDGKLNDPCWERAAAFSPMASNMGGGNTNYTQAYAAYDNENLFIAVRAWDEELDPVKNQLHQIVKGKTGANANSWNADSIEVFVAPRQNSPDQYFQFGFNLAGGYDAIHPQKSIQWESGVESAAQLLDHRWEMEIRIPLKALGVSGDLAGKRWFFNLCRNKHGGNQKNAVWSPTNGSFHNYSRFGEVEFVARAPRIELKEKAISSGKEGGNELNFKITSDQDQTLTFRNFVSYQNADSAVAEDSVQVRAGKTTEFRNSYFVAAGTPERKSSESFSCNYEIRDADGKLIQRSATTTFPLDRYAPLKNKFMCTTSNVIIKYFDSLHINQDSARSMQLLLQVDEKLLPKTKKVNFQVEMPEYISLFDLDAKDKTSCIPTDIKEEIIVRDGKKYRRISMDVDSKWLYTLDGIGAGPKQRRYGKWVLITFDCAKDAPLGGGEKITYASSAHIDGKTYQSPEASMSLHVLPPIKGARFPTSYLMQYDIGPWMITLSKMSYNECERFLDNLERAGVNSVSYNEYGMNKDQLKQIRNRSFSIYAYIPVNAARSYRSNAFPGAEEYLKKHPDYRAVDRNGKSHDDGICFDIVSREDSPYDEEMYTWMAPYAEEFDALLWDYEVPPAAARSFCFCERCLNAFAEYAGLQSVNRDDAATKHLAKWTEFQARRGAKICQKLYNAVKKANPECELWFYSGYQSESTLKAYSVDWSLLGSVIDRAFCGYGRPLQQIKDTKAAIGEKKLVLGLLMLVWYGSQYDYTHFNNSLWRRLTDSDGGVLFYVDMQMDGRFFDAVGKASVVINDHFEFFDKYQRGDDLCRIQGTTADNMTVLRNPAGERIIVLFNALGQAKEYTLENLNVPPGARLKDEFTGKVYDNPEKATVTVPGNDVKVLSLKKT